MPTSNILPIDVRRPEELRYLAQNRRADTDGTALFVGTCRTQLVSAHKENDRNKRWLRAIALACNVILWYYISHSVYFLLNTPHSSPGHCVSSFDGRKYSDADLRTARIICMCSSASGQIYLKTIFRCSGDWCGSASCIDGGGSRRFASWSALSPKGRYNSVPTTGEYVHLHASYREYSAPSIRAYIKERELMRIETVQYNCGAEG